MENERVTFEQAEALAEIYQYNGKHRHCYSVDDKTIHNSHEKINHNINKIWTGRGWKYFQYSAPTKDEAIIYLMDLCSNLERRCNEYSEEIINIKCQK